MIFKDVIFHHPSQTILNKLSQKYNKNMLVGYFNAYDSETCLSNFLFELSAKNIVDNYTWYKGVENPSCIGFVITNSPLRFQNTVTITKGLSEFHKITLLIIVLKTMFAKLIPRNVIYRDYKNFNKDEFKRKLERIIMKTLI